MHDPDRYTYMVSWYGLLAAAAIVGMLALIKV